MTTDFAGATEIQRGVPIPKVARVSRFDRHFENLLPGTSTLVSGSKKTIKQAQAAAYNFGYRHGWSMTTRVTMSGNLRVWRNS